MHCTPCFSFSISCSEIRIQIVPGTKLVLMLSVKVKAGFISLVPRQLARFYSSLCGLTTASSQECFLTAFLATSPTSAFGCSCGRTQPLCSPSRCPVPPWDLIQLGQFFMAGDIINDNLDSSEVVVFLPVCVHYILPITPACN